MKKKFHLLLFTRFPEAGTTKTRLIPTLGADGAARLQKQLTEKTAAESLCFAENLDVSITIHFCGGSKEKMKHWLGTEFTYVKQAGGTIGRKMKIGLTSIFQGDAQKALLIGSDIPGLTTDILRQAYNGLLTSEVVIGPSYDGGYYLIGCTVDHRQQILPLLFDKIAWSTPTVLATTLNRLEEKNIIYTLLPNLQDIDQPEDLALAQKSGLL